MKRIKVQIEKSTKKAHLITSEDGRRGWIQQRWLRADSTVSKKVLDKAVVNFKERQAAHAEATEWADSYHRILEVARETEKAVAVKANFDAYNLERDFQHLVWIPKSLLHGLAVPGWFIIKKVRQITEELYEELHTGVRCDYIAVEDCDRLYY